MSLTIFVSKSCTGQLLQPALHYILEGDSKSLSIRQIYCAKSHLEGSWSSHALEEANACPFPTPSTSRWKTFPAALPLASLNEALSSASF